MARKKNTNNKSSYYKTLDILRVLSCIAVFLYHLNILKGGYLAVCIFFVLTGYLSCISAFKKEKFSLKEYYISRFKRIYLPLLFVVFLSICVISFIPNVNWLTLKPETISVLLGYNNYWQINANMDYFARHINSPFMHFWYIGILLQFELVFPFIFIGLRKIEGVIKKKGTVILLGIISIISTVFFFISCYSNPNLMSVYYSTFTRLFSIIYGITIGFIIYYFNSFIHFKNKSTNKKLFIFYLIVLIAMFIFIDYKSILFPFAMILTSLITCRLIDFSTLFTGKLSITDKIMKYIGSISYEVYLFQYPVIFIFQYIMFKNYLSIPLIILITFVISIILHTALDLKNKKIYKFILLIIITIPSLFGVYKFIVEKDHTEELNQLKADLVKSEEVMKAKQEQYRESLKKENEEYEKQLKELENGSNNIGDVITNLPLVCVGDSVMLGASPRIYKTFNNVYVDAKVSRSDYSGAGILKDLSDKGMLTDTIVLHLGTNGSCGNRCRDQVMDVAGNRKVFFMTVTNDADVHVNDGLKEYVNNHPNAYLVDWYEAGLGHPEYFAADKIHLNSSGMDAYAKSIYDAIYNVYKEEFDKKREEMINNHNNELKNKITFYGNDLLINAFKNLEKDYSNAEFEMNKDYNYDKLVKQIKDNKPNYNVVFVFDGSFRFNNKQFREITKLLKDNKIYLLKFTNDKTNYNYDNVEVIDFNKELVKHDDYLMVDNIHLTDKGNKKLNELINNSLKKEITDK